MQTQHYSKSYNLIYVNVFTLLIIGPHVIMDTAQAEEWGVGEAP
jgi:hypothetical protein